VRLTICRAGTFIERAPICPENGSWESAASLIAAARTRLAWIAVLALLETRLLSLAGPAGPAGFFDQSNRRRIPGT